MSRRHVSYLIDCILIFLAVAVLIRPMFKVKYLELWASIESTFISDARFLRDHWPHPNWQPNWYCGTRTDYVYPPALRYGTAVITKVVPKVLPVKAYHIYSAFFYCMGIAAIYVFARYASGSRLSGYLAAAATALLSPSYLFSNQIRLDAFWRMPTRLNVLVRYGEGPHMTALAWIPLALFFSFRALQQWRPISLALAAVCSAMVVSNNFYGATALAMLFPVLTWSVYITHGDLWIWVRATAIGVLAYGLTAFWLVPSYLKLTIANMRFVSSEGNAWSFWVMLAVVIGFVLFSDHFAKGRRELTYLVFVCGATAVFATNVLGNHFFDFRLIGEPSRLFPELDLVLALFAVELLRRLGSAQVIWRKVAAGAVITVALASSYDYLTHARRLFMVDPDPTDEVEYQMQDWMAKNMPKSRAFAAGSVRFWYNAWNDLQQVGGGSEQGLLNSMVMPAQWEILLGPEFNLSLWWLQLLGADAVLVNEAHSKERYHDFQSPDKFRGKLPVLHDDGAGNIIYGVPRRYGSLARVVDTAKFNALPEIPGNGTESTLTAWVDAVENGPDVPTTTEWLGTDALRVHAPVQQGQSVFLEVTFDSNWRAYADGRRVPTRRNHLGFMTIDAPPGSQEIRLEFPLPFSNRVGYALFAMSLLVIGGLVYLGRR
ncbi:MAG TPA: hypothetical protein VER03_06385 [Bryobacteraceae bacterium]|nr:hypothetical protein [Bryobacteraceae bacterium]